MRINSEIIFLLVVATVLVGYMFFRICRHHRWMQVLICVIGVEVIAATLGLQHYMRYIIEWRHYTYVQWFLFCYIFVVALSAPVGVLAVVAKLTRPKFWNRHRQGITASGLMLGMVPATILLYGALYERYKFDVVRVDLDFDDLPRVFDGYTIAAIGDTHLGSLLGDTTMLRPAIDSINAARPDAIVFLGDLVNNFADEATNWTEQFARLEAPQKIAIMGNHDYSLYTNWPSREAKDANTDAVKQSYRDMGFDLLLNERRRVRRQRESIYIVGVEDRYQGDYLRSDSVFLRSHFCLLLQHSPEHFDRVNREVDPRFALTLCGHTHGGQIGLRVKSLGLVWSIAKFMFPYDAGLFDCGDHGYLYVNVGIGTNGLPLRIGVRPEVTLITLHRRSEENWHRDRFFDGL